MSKLFWCFVVFVLVVMVDQTEGWPRRRRRRCNARICSVSSWSSWSSCSRSCGGGRQTRSREVIANSKCGGGCPYSLGDYHYCNRSPCPGEGEAIYQHTVGVKWLFFTLKTVYSFLFLNAEVSEGIIRESRNGSHYYMQVRTPEHKRSDKHQGKIN